MDKSTIEVYKDGRAVTIDRNSLAVFLKHGYTKKKETEKKSK